MTCGDTNFTNNSLELIDHSVCKIEILGQS